MLGDMLLQMDKPTEALAAYRTALEFATNRFDSLLGAKTAAAKSGDVRLSEEYGRKLSTGGQTASRP
jgi:cytochrome c-type biogenesis protein CcmH/NrfG